MDDEDKYKIEKIGTPAGDAASAQSVVKAINYILLKLKELDDYYTDKLKYVDISSLDPIIEGIHEKLDDLKITQDLFTQKLSELEKNLDSTNLGSQKTSIISSDKTDADLSSDSNDIKEIQTENLSKEKIGDLKQLINTILSRFLDDNDPGNINQLIKKLFNYCSKQRVKIKEETLTKVKEKIMTD